MADDGPPEDLTKEDLWNRLRRLEQHVFPSRRQMLKAGGAAALFGAGAVGGAAATPGDDGDTVWGSSSNRDDYYVDELDANMVSTAEQSVGGQPSINYWPPEPINSNEIDDDSPTTSFTTATLSALPSDANFALVEVAIVGDGTAASMECRVREAGSSRPFDIRVYGWAGHGAFSAANSDIVPVNSNNEIEYKSDDGNIDRIFISVTGYF